MVFQKAADAAPAFADDETRPHMSRATLLRVFLAALLIRWIYALLLYALMGNDGLKGVDSFTYAQNAQLFAEAIRAGSIHGSQWLGEAPYTMPLYQWLTTLPFLFFGNGGAIAYILIQSAFDSATCVLVYGIASSLDQRLALPSAIVAILNPTQIVLSGLIYTDTPFTFFVALAFFCAVSWVRIPAWRNAIWLGCALGCAALIRVSIAPWGFCAMGLLVAFALWRRIPFRQLSNLSIAAVILCLSLGAIAVRNFNQYGTFALTPQGGDYLALWIVPLAKEAQDRTPYTTSLENMIARTTQRFGPPSSNPFEQSRRYQQIGREVLRDEIKLTSLAASWASGIFINLASPAHLLSPPVSELPRTGFYGTPGDSFVEKVFNYAFRSGNPTYSWLLILGSFGLAIVRVVQLLGAWALAGHRRYWPKIIFASSWIAFLLLLNGPIASPKYRLPLEPLFNIMTAAGILSIQDWRKRRQARFHALGNSEQS
jgi:4-amino-4-deoxy-L-arabinose transferase-like glycosyltransferase